MLQLAFILAQLIGLPQPVLAIDLGPSCDPATRGIECVLPPLLYDEYIAVQGIIRNLPVRF